jgi:uncharacterized repeat protein (TIGR01451 family)
VASAIISVTFVDPYGVVFDSVTDTPVKGAEVTIYTSAGVKCVPGVQIAATDSNPQTTGVDGAYGYLTINGDFYITVNSSGYTSPSQKTTFPPDRTITIGSKGEIFTVAGAVLHIDYPLDSNVLFLKVAKSVNKKEVSVGSIVTYTVTMQNTAGNDITNVYLQDNTPAGFKYINGRAILDNVAIADPTGNRPLTFNIGTVSTGQTKTLKYQLVVGSGVTLGTYENTVFAKYSDGAVISNNSSASVKVAPDPMFDLGTVIGKVFYDNNSNGVQDKDEEPVPNARIVTEDGTIITTDQDGKYHLQAIMPGRHLFRLDERSLPEGAYLTTDKVVVADITEGLLFKVNFGVKLKRVSILNSQRDRVVPGINLIQENSTPQPRLNVSLLSDALFRDKNKEFSPAQFFIFTNYSLFIKDWRIEILDKDTRALTKVFEGDTSTINQPIYWDAKDKDGNFIDTQKNYIYRLIVIGKDGREDLTKYKSLVIKDDDPAIEKTEEVISLEKEVWMAKEGKVNDLEKRNIKIEGDTIKVESQDPDAGNIRILKSGKLQAEIPVTRQKGLTAKELPVDFIAPNGEYDIEIASDNLERDGSVLNGHENRTVPISRDDAINEAMNLESLFLTPQPGYAKHIKISEDRLFFVAMGDSKMGYNFNRGYVEEVTQDDKFNKGFWSEGKLAYYLKGKILGKYMVTSSLDSDREKKELFRNLDPDKFYPVYGDGSSVNYDATNTQGKLYLLVEWDKSKALWGNYNTEFTDTEFAQFSRTLYGGKVYYEDVANTKFGEPRTKLVVFRARAKQKSAHNEFTGTGGSLYYLKNKDLTEGSDKVTIEMRDKITGLVLATKAMERNVEYEVDYSEGRIVFWKPVSQICESESIISSQLLDGNPVYVIADYEYETKEQYDEGSYGGRIQQSFTDYLRVGGTYVKEEQLNSSYILKGVDTIAHLGENIKFTAELAETESSAMGSFVSTDGGLSFTELAVSNSDKGKAYGIKGEAYILGRLGLTGYYKRIEKGFSSSATSSQQGKELIGGAATFDLTSKTRLKVAHDIQKLIDDGNAQTETQVGARKTETTTAQITHQAGKRLKLTGEYRDQSVTEKIAGVESETNTDNQTVAAKIDYKATPKLKISLEQQATLKGPANNQTTLGITDQINKDMQLRAKQVVGNQGIATGAGATLNLKDKLDLAGDYSITNNAGVAGSSASLGVSSKVDDKTKLHTTYGVTDSGDSETKTFTYGLERKINDNLTLTTDKSYATGANTVTESDTYGLSREKDGKKLAGKFTQSVEQGLTSSTLSNIFGLSGDINDKWAGLMSFEKGKVQNLDGTRTSRNAGSFGLSYVDKDKFKASSKLEFRFDKGDEDTRQFLTYTAAEGKINPNTTVFGKANISWTENTTIGSISARYKEISAGVAYRPVKFDRLNLLGSYTYLEDDSPSSQESYKDIERERSHVLSAEAVYDVNEHWQLTEKLAYKIGEEQVAGFDFTRSNTRLWINRLNYNINNDWQAAVEYRNLAQEQAKDLRQGVLLEIVRKIGEFVQVGLGYNFTDFNDDLTRLNYTSQGPFVRLTGKLYDRTPEEIAVVREKWLNARIKKWTSELVNKELARPGSKPMRELSCYFYLAEQAQKLGALEEAKELYSKILQVNNTLYINAEAYVRQRIELEEKIKEYNARASSLYKSGRHLEAKSLWQKMIKESEPATINFYVN